MEDFPLQEAQILPGVTPKRYMSVLHLVKAIVRDSLRPTQRATGEEYGQHMQNIQNAFGKPMEMDEEAVKEEQHLA